MSFKDSINKALPSAEEVEGSIRQWLDKFHGTIKDALADGKFGQVAEKFKALSAEAQAKVIDGLSDNPKSSALVGALALQRLGEMGNMHTAATGMALKKVFDGKVGMGSQLILGTAGFRVGLQAGRDGTDVLDRITHARNRSAIKKNNFNIRVAAGIAGGKLAYDMAGNVSDAVREQKSHVSDEEGRNALPPGTDRQR